MIAPECLMPPAEAAAKLGISDGNLKDRVATGRVRCGVIAPGWYGHAQPEFGDHSWHGGMIDLHPDDKRLSTYRFRCSKTRDEYVVAGACAAQFWYLDHHDAYLLALSETGTVECTWLRPLDGIALHQHAPEKFPWPDFVFALWESQDRSRTVSWSRIRFLSRDIEQLIGARGSEAAKPMRETQTDRIRRWVEECERRAAQCGKAFSRSQMPGTKSEFLHLLHALDADLRSIKTVASLDRYLKGYKWQGGRQQSALPLYAKLFPNARLPGAGLSSSMN